MLLTNEHKRVWDVVVAHVDDGGTDPRADALLRSIEDNVHHTRGFRRSLDTIETLACVTQTIRHVFGEQVLLCKRP